VHGEIIFEVPEKMANDAAAILRETTIEAGLRFMTATVVKCVRFRGRDFGRRRV